MAQASESVLELPAIKAIAQEVARTPAQVVLRWGVQRGTSVIPKTQNHQRLGENLSLLDFELTEEQMATIGRLDRGQRFNDPGAFYEQAFGCYYPIYE
jgi:D-xylose reductase